MRERKFTHIQSPEWAKQKHHVGGYSHPSPPEKLPVDGCSPRSGAGSPEHIFTRKMLVGGKDPDPKCISLAGHVIARVFSTCIKKYLTERDRQYNNNKWL